MVSNGFIKKIVDEKKEEKGKLKRKSRKVIGLITKYASSALFALYLSSCCGTFLKDTKVNVKGVVTPVSVSWDITFMGHFEEKTKEEIKKDLEKGNVDEKAKREALRVFRRLNINDEKTLKLLKDLESNDKEVVKDAIFILGEKTYSGKEVELKFLVIKNIREFLYTDDYELRAHALLALTKLRYPVLDEAKMMLFDKEPLIRYVAAYHISQLGNESCLNALKKAFAQETQPTARRMMEKAIKSIERNVEGNKQ